MGRIHDTNGQGPAQRAMNILATGVSPFEAIHWADVSAADEVSDALWGMVDWAAIDFAALRTESDEVLGVALAHWCSSLDRGSEDFFRRLGIARLDRRYPIMEKSIRTTRLHRRLINRAAIEAWGKTGKEACTTAMEKLK